MPQSLYDIDPDAGFSIDDEVDHLERHPRLALLVMKIIAGWSVVQGFIGLAAASLLKGRANVAMAMFETLSESSSQYNALYAAAKVTLDKDDAELFCVALKVVRKLGHGRHRLAHAIYVESEKVGEALIAVDVKHFANMTKIFVTPPSLGESRKDQVRRESKIFIKNAFVYYEEDLEHILKEVKLANRIATEIGVLAAPIHHNRKDAIDRLKSIDLIAQRLSR